MLGTERREGGKAVGRQPRGERLCPSVVSAYLCTLSPSRDIDSLSQESERKGEDAKKASTTEAAFGRFAVFLLCACYSRLSLSPSWSSSSNPLISCAFPHPAQVHLLAITTDSDPHRFQFALRHSSSTHTTNHYEEYGLLSQERGPTSPWVNYNSIMQFFLCWCVFSSIHSLAALRLYSVCCYVER